MSANPATTRIVAIAPIPIKSFKPYSFSCRARNEPTKVATPKKHNAHDTNAAAPIANERFNITSTVVISVKAIYARLKRLIHTPHFARSLIPSAPHGPRRRFPQHRNHEDAAAAAAPVSAPPAYQRGPPAARPTTRSLLSADGEAGYRGGCLVGLHSRASFCASAICA